MPPKRTSSDSALSKRKLRPRVNGRVVRGQPGSSSDAGDGASGDGAECDAVPLAYDTHDAHDEADAAQQEEEEDTCCVCLEPKSSEPSIRARCVNQPECSILTCDTCAQKSGIGFCPVCDRSRHMWAPVQVVQGTRIPPAMLEAMQQQAGLESEDLAALPKTFRVEVDGAGIIAPGNTCTIIVRFYDGEGQDAHRCELTKPQVVRILTAQHRMPVSIVESPDGELLPTHDTKARPLKHGRESVRQGGRGRVYHGIKLTWGGEQPLGRGLQLSDRMVARLAANPTQTHQRCRLAVTLYLEGLNPPGLVRKFVDVQVPAVSPTAVAPSAVSPSTA